MEYREAIEYIHSIDWRGSRPGLERITELCDMLGNPQKNLRFIHIAGTNGKGSTAAMIASILKCAGYRVGLFSSPFVEKFNERIVYDGEMISDEDLAFFTAKVRQFADTMKDGPTEFELITAIAFMYYSSKKCDFVVLECGLGGRLDSTNVVDTSVLSIITGIAIDHAEILGDTTEKIALEKAGIIKKGVPVIYGEVDENAKKVIENTASNMGSECTGVPYDKLHVRSETLDKTVFEYMGETYEIVLHGTYQTRNACIVLEAVRKLKELGISITSDAVHSGLKNARWKARFEVICEQPLVIYDGAHNIQGISAAIESIKKYLSPLTPDGKVNILMGVMADKEYSEMIHLLTPVTRKAFTVTPGNKRSLAAGNVSREFRDNRVNAVPYLRLDYGVRYAMADAYKHEVPLVCLGSLYMYSDVKVSVKREKEKNNSYR